MIEQFTAKLGRKEDLSAFEMTSSMKSIMSGQETTEDIAAFLLGLAEKGETVEEIVSAVKVMRSLAVPVNPGPGSILDTCGTGGDRKGTFNISTTAAFVAAGRGITVAKHGNKAVSSTCGSADVLKQLGISISMPVERIEACLRQVGIAFLYAPDFHPAMRFASEARKKLGRRTIFNIMGPMSNPAGATHQLVGVFSADLMRIVVDVLAELGTRRALVIHSKDGLDEISTAGVTMVCESRGRDVKCYDITPEMSGLPRVSAEDLIGGSVEENAAIVLDILTGKKGPKRDIVLLNAAGAIYAADGADSMEKAMRFAADSIDSGAAMKKFMALKEFSVYG